MRKHIYSAYSNQISVKAAYRYAYDAFVYRGGYRRLFEIKRGQLCLVSYSDLEEAGTKLLC